MTDTLKKSLGLGQLLTPFNLIYAIELQNCFSNLETRVHESLSTFRLVLFLLQQCHNRSTL